MCPHPDGLIHEPILIKFEWILYILENILKINSHFNKNQQTITAMILLKTEIKMGIDLLT